MRGLALFLLTAAWTPPAWSVRVDAEARLKSFLAALIAAQVHAAMRSRLGPALFPNPKAAAFLTGSFFRHGAARDWRELLAEATGGPLAPDAYLEDLLGAVGP